MLDLAANSYSVSLWYWYSNWENGSGHHQMCNGLKPYYSQYSIGVIIFPSSHHLSAQR